MNKEAFKEFQNIGCEYYPCHKSDEFVSCMFCYCPLYQLDCDGDYTMSKTDLKDCSNCNKPHTENGWEFVFKQLRVHIFNKDKL